MSKLEFIDAAKALYRVANMADSDSDPQREAWTHPSMAHSVCQPLDAMFQGMVNSGVLTENELQGIYDTL